MNIPIAAFERLLELLFNDYEYRREFQAVCLKHDGKGLLQKIAEYTIRYLRVAKEPATVAWKEAHAPSEAEEKRVYDLFVAYGSGFMAKRFQIKISEPL